MTYPGNMHGVKSRPRVTPEGDYIVAIKYAVMSRVYFAVVKHKDRAGSTYSLRKLKKGGGFARSTPKGIANLVYATEGDAKRGIWLWDFKGGKR